MLVAFMSWGQELYILFCTHLHCTLWHLPVHKTSAQLTVALKGMEGMF